MLSLKAGADGHGSEVEYKALGVCHSLCKKSLATSENLHSALNFKQNAVGEKLRLGFHCGKPCFPKYICTLYLNFKCLLNLQKRKPFISVFYEALLKDSVNVHIANIASSHDYTNITYF